MNIRTLASSSAGSCYIIESGGEQLLIECGISLSRLRKALDFDLKKVVGCLISHEHKDHCKSIVELSQKTNIPLYGSESLEDQYPELYNYTPVESAPVVFQCGFKFMVKPIKVIHDVSCYAYVIQAGKNIAFYATDTGQVNFKIAGLTHLMIETNHSFHSLLNSQLDKTLIRRIADNHLSIEQSIDFAINHKTTLREVHIIHISDNHGDEQKFKKMVQEALGIPVYISQK